MIDQSEVKTLRNFWIIFQIIIPLALISIEVVFRWGNSYHFFDFLKSQKLMLMSLVIYLGLFSKVLSERRFVNSENITIVYISINHLSYYIGICFIGLAIYLILLKWGSSVEGSHRIFYLILSVLLYTVFIVVVYSLYMTYLGALLNKSKK